MTLQEFTKEFDRHFIPFVRQALKRYKKLVRDEEIFKLISHIETYASGGKRLRPYGVYLGLQTKNKKIGVSEWMVMISLELIHVLALVHDDIIDKALTRRSTDSVNGYITKEVSLVRGDGVHYANSQAILVGDLMFSLAFQALAESRVPVAVQHKVHQLLDEVILGQMIDVKLAVSKEASRDLILRKSKYKTALYTFARPFEIGGLVAKAPMHVQKNLYTIGELLGLAYQAQDDYLDVFGNEAILKKDIMNDIREGQQTLLTHYFFSHANEEQKALFSKYFGTSFSEKYNPTIRSLFGEVGVDVHCKKEVMDLFAKTRKKIRESSLPFSVQSKFQELVDALEARIKEL